MGDIGRSSVTAEKRHNITVRFGDEELMQLREIAARENRPVANMIVWFVVTYLRQSGSPVSELTK